MPVRRVSHSSAHCIVSSYSQSSNHDNSHWEAVPQTPESDVAIYPRHSLSSAFSRYGNTAVSMASLTTLEGLLVDSRFRSLFSFETITSGIKSAYAIKAPEGVFSYQQDGTQPQLQCQQCNHQGTQPQSAAARCNALSASLKSCKSATQHFQKSQI